MRLVNGWAGMRWVNGDVLSSGVPGMYLDKLRGELVMVGIGDEATRSLVGTLGAPVLLACGIGI